MNALIVARLLSEICGLRMPHSRQRNILASSRRCYPRREINDCQQSGEPDWGYAEKHGFRDVIDDENYQDCESDSLESIPIEASYNPVPGGE